MVLLLHNTSHVDGDAHPNLLREKGGNGFPYLVWLDAEGNVLARQGARSVAGFTATLDALERLDGAKAKLASGDAGAAADVFLAELGLGKLDAAKAKARLAELQLTPEQRKDAEQRIVSLEVSELLRGRDRDAVGKQLVAMWQAGRVPVDDVRRSFWTTILGHAQSARDPGLYERALAQVKQDADLVEKLGRRAPEQMAATLRKLQAHAAARQRVQDGDEAAGVELLLADLDFGDVAFADAKQRAASLRPSEAQRAALDAELLELEVRELSLARRPRERAAAAKRFQELLAEGRVPKGNSRSAFWTTLLSQAEATRDVAAAKRALAGLQEAMAGNPRAARVLEAAAKRVAELEQGGAQANEGSDAGEGGGR